MSFWFALTYIISLQKLNKAQLTIILTKKIFLCPAKDSVLGGGECAASGGVGLWEREISVAKRYLSAQQGSNWGLAVTQTHKQPPPTRACWPGLIKPEQPASKHLYRDCVLTQQNIVSKND